MNDENKNSIESLSEYVQSHTIDEILFAGLRRFYRAVDHVPFEELVDRFNSEKFNELGEPLSYFRDNIEEIKQNFNKFENVYTNLTEEKSKIVFLNMLCAKIYMDLDCVRSAYDTENIYFDLSIWGKLTDEVYVDCGGYTGDTALSFICHCPSYRKIYVLEPLDEIKKNCEKNLDFFIKEGNATIINRAAYDKETRLKFAKNYGTGDSCIEEDGEIEVLSTSLDLAIKEPISFIKMDIEGSEKCALEGARLHIQADAPKMAVCVYHLSDDFWKIPELILNINPKYDFIFRQHRPDTFSETVLYAIPKQQPALSKKTYSADIKYSRIQNSLKQIRLVSYEEFDNLMDNVKDKAWYLYQIRMHNEEIQQLSDEKNLLHSNSEEQILLNKSWIDELQEGKDYLEHQLENYKAETERLTSALEEQKSWSDQLQQSKDYLEGQVTNYIGENEKLNNELATQKEWVAKLEEGKSYLQNQVANYTAETERLNNLLAEQKNWSEELVKSKDYLQGQLENHMKETEQLKNLLDEQKNWSEELVKSKDYLQGQLENYTAETERLNHLLTEQKEWSTQLQAGKEYLEDSLNKIQVELKTSQKKVLDLEEEETDLRNELLKNKYKLSKLLNDSLIKKIIRLKKIEL